MYRPGFNVNGIEALPDGSRLVLVQSNTGSLFTADPATGVTTEIDLGGAAVTAGDGIVLHGHTLYVVRNQRNEVAVVALAPDLTSGAVVREISDPAFDIPTTADRFGNRLYLVNARFTTPPTDDTEYWVTAVSTR